MPEVTIAEILARARGRSPVVPLDNQEAGRVNEAAVDRAAVDAVGQAPPTDMQIEQPPVAGSPLPLSTVHQRLLDLRARHAPQDTKRWRDLIHNAWQLHENHPLFWHLLSFCLLGAQLVAHSENGLAIRYSADQMELLRRAGRFDLFADEAEYRRYATEFLAPNREALTRLLSLTALGIIVDEDMSWVASIKPETRSA